MRIVKGSIAEVFHIHKMWQEFMEDTGQGSSDSLEPWIPKFCDPKFFCIMAIHGKKWVGMSWGYVPDAGDLTKRLEVEGIFIKRGFRQRLKASKLLTDALLEIATKTQAVALSSVVPETCVKGLKRKGFRVSALVVEKTL